MQDRLTVSGLDAMPAMLERADVLVVTVPRLSGLDFSAGFDDFVLDPLVPAELYARTAGVGAFVRTELQAWADARLARSRMALLRGRLTGV